MDNMLRYPECGVGEERRREVMKVTYPGGKGKPGQWVVSSWGR